MSDSTEKPPASPPPPSSPTSNPHVTLKDFLASLAAIRGDLSNITAPPFVLDTKSVVELPAFWAERPSFFVSPASAADAAQRALLVLRWFLVSLRNQQYGGRSEADGVKKPLNAFLGECFLAEWGEKGSEDGVTTLVSEQVSHHPPVTATRLWNEKHGVYAEGFTRQEITLSLGAVAVRQTGHALLTLRRHSNETYLIPLPDVKVKGILSGLSGTYPELEGTWMIPCTSGYYSVIEFSGKSTLASLGATSSNKKKNAFIARLYAPGSVQENPLYTIEGHWNEAFTVYRGAETSPSTAMEKLVLQDLPTAPMRLLEPDIDAQDPWESRRAWKGVREALIKGDMLAAAKAKSVVEQGQRDMRKEEERTRKIWESLFFRPEQEDSVAASLYRSILKELKPETTVAIWKFDEERWERGTKKPYHGNLTPDNKNSLKTNGTDAKPVLPKIAQLSTDGRNGSSLQNGDGDDNLASPASFKTAHEYFPTNPAPEEPSATMASKIAPPIQPPPPVPSTPKRQSIDRGNGSAGELTPSSASMTPSARRGRRQRARDSIGKFTSSLSSGLSKLSPGRGAENGEEKR